MRKKAIIGVLTLMLSTSVLLPSLTSFAVENPTAIVLTEGNEILQKSIEFNENNSINSSKETLNQDLKNIEPRGFNFSKIAVKIKQWKPGLTNLVKKWTIASTADWIADTIKVAWDKLRAITVDREYVGPGYNTTGDPVKTVQSALNNRGYSAGTADGIYGPNTKNAIIRFQRSRGLAADGIVGPATWRQLMEQ